MIALCILNEECVVQPICEKPFPFSELMNSSNKNKPFDGSHPYYQMNHWPRSSSDWSNVIARITKGLMFYFCVWEKQETVHFVNLETFLGHFPHLMKSSGPNRELFCNSGPVLVFLPFLGRSLILKYGVAFYL